MQACDSASSSTGSSGASSNVSLKQVDAVDASHALSRHMNKSDRRSIKDDHDNGNNDDHQSKSIDENDTCTLDGKKKKSEMIDKSLNDIKDTSSEDAKSGGEMLSSQLLTSNDKEKFINNKSGRQSDEWRESVVAVDEKQLKAYASDKSLKLNSLDQCEKLVESHLPVSINGFPQ